MNEIRNKKLFLLDMDGTLYLGMRLFPSVPEFLAHIRKSGGKYVFMTNNSSKGVASYIEKMGKLGIKTEESDFLTSADATVAYLKEKNHRLIYVFGTKSFTAQLKKAGLPVTTERQGDIDCLCMGFDTELSFSKLEDACILLQSNIDYIATNPDYVCPTEYGYVPDCGSVADMLYNATKKRPYVIGKPNTAMPLLAMKKYGYTKEETVIIGDRLYTDIACGIRAGIDTAYVLCGEGTQEDIKNTGINPGHVYRDIAEIYREISK